MSLAQLQAAADRVEAAVNRIEARTGQKSVPTSGESPMPLPANQDQPPPAAGVSLQDVQAMLQQNSEALKSEIADLLTKITHAQSDQSQQSETPPAEGSDLKALQEQLAEAQEQQAQLAQQLDQIKSAAPMDGKRFIPPDTGEQEMSDRELKALQEYYGTIPGTQQPAVSNPTKATTEMKSLGAYYADPVTAMTNPEVKTELVVGRDEGGGYVVMPERILNRFYQAVDDLTFVRAHAQIERVMDASSVSAITLEDDVGDMTWSGEIIEPKQDTSMRLGKRALRPHPLSIEVRISNTLIRLAFIDIVGKVNERLAARFGMRMEYFYLNGNGANQPLGIFTAHEQGIPTGRDVTTKNAGEVQFTDLRSMKYAIKQQYWPKLRWVMSRQTAEVMANITDSTGRTLWADSVRTGEPPTLMGFPVQMSEFAPAPVSEAGTFTTGKYAVMLGSFEDGYMVLDAMNFKVEVYRELEARKNQTVYIGRYEGDGAPLNINGAEMWARLKIK